MMCKHHSGEMQHPANANNIACEYMLCAILMSICDAMSCDYVLLYGKWGCCTIVYSADEQHILSWCCASMNHTLSLCYVCWLMWRFINSDWCWWFKTELTYHTCELWRWYVKCWTVMLFCDVLWSCMITYQYVFGNTDVWHTDDWKCMMRSANYKTWIRNVTYTCIMLDCKMMLQFQYVAYEGSAQTTCFSDVIVREHQQSQINLSVHMFDHKLTLLSPCVTVSHLH